MMYELRAKRISQNVLVIALVAIACVCSSIATTAAHAAGTGILPTNANIHYVGRWDSSSSTTYTSYWGGAYFTTIFTGRTVEIKLASPGNIYVLIDNGEDTRYLGATGTVNLTPTPLAAGEHTLRVASRSERDTIAFQGLVLDAGAQTIATPIPSQAIEFVGDSITAGATDTKLVLSSYGWLIGKDLGVRHTHIAKGGICLTDKVRCSGGPLGMSTAYFNLKTPYFPNSPLWDFSRYRPNIVVINLGTNDNGHNVSDATFQSAYIAFIQHIRAKLPNTRIIVLRPFSGAKAASSLAAVNAVRAAGDLNVEYVDTTGWITPADTTNGGVHPTDAGHVKIANRLGPILAPMLGLSWKAI